MRSKQEPRFLPHVNSVRFLELMAEHQWPQWVWRDSPRKGFLFTSFGGQIYRICREHRTLDRFVPEHGTFAFDWEEILTLPGRRDFVTYVKTKLPEIVMEMVL